MSPTRPLYWSVRRELWENRSLYIAPMVVAAVFLFGFLLSTITLPHRMRAIAGLDPLKQRDALAMPYTFASLLIMGITFIVALFYCLDALYGERRDRSILFWKSLPVSDLTTVLAKASIPILLLPALTFVITMVTQWIMLLLSTAVLAGSGSSVTMLWSQLPLFHMSLMLFYHLLAIHGLWYAPFWGWLLLVSSWARRVPVLWAALPVIAIAIVEKAAFNTMHFVTMLQYRMTGGGAGAARTAGDMSSSMSMDHMTMDPAAFLLSPGLWIGLVIAAAFLAAAVRLRRYREPI